MSLREMEEREQRCVCKMCGGPLKQKMIVFDRYGGHGMELYCEHCQKVEYGTEPEIYALANRFVEQTQFNYYLDMQEDRRSEMLNISKICEIFSWFLREIDLLDGEGIHLAKKK
ncbi:MAG: hypothetical protein IJ936_03490 [Peptococcaceae bacterium]|nr:hypothetical protein [Peptococcaceae bacterium]